MNLFQMFSSGGSNDQIKKALENGAKIIDVRSPGEYAGGHVKGSLNIPLDTIPKNIEKIKGFQKPVVLCCASGMRSGQATDILKKNGIAEVYNGGSLRNLEN